MTALHGLRRGSSGQRRPTPHEGGRVAYDYGAQRWVWRCCLCGAHGHWAEGWRWYGSAWDEDDGAVRLVAFPAHTEAELQALAGGGAPPPQGKQR